MIGLAIWLISVIVCGALGAAIARRAELPVVAGAAIGGLFNVLGVVFLLGVWGAEWVEEKLL